MLHLAHSDAGMNVIVLYVYFVWMKLIIKKILYRTCSAVIYLNEIVIIKRN